MDSIGFIYAIIAALCWGSYLVPFKKSGSQQVILFQLLMGFSIVIATTVLTLLVNFSFNLNQYGIAAGVIWALANWLSLIAIENLGLSKGVPFMASVGILFSFTLGSLAFNELPGGLLMPLVGVLFIVAGVWIAGSTGNIQSKNIKKGLMFGLVTGVLFGGQFVPIKVSGLAPTDYFFAMSVGICLTATVIALINKVKFSLLAVKESFLSGFIWTLGNLMGMLAISLIGLSKGFPITQAAVLVAVGWGLFYFKEITSFKDRRQVLFGASVLLIGIIVLGLS